MQKKGQPLRDKKLANFGAGKLAAPSCTAATPLTKPHDPLYDNRFDGWNPNSHQRRWAYSWRKLRTKAGLPDVEFYHLGHTSITAGGEQNVPLALMKSLAGHMDSKMTEYYTGIRDNPKVQAVKAIESANPSTARPAGNRKRPRC